MFSGFDCALIRTLIEKMLHSSPRYEKKVVGFFFFFFFNTGCFNIVIIEGERKKKATPECDLHQRENYIAEKHTTF